MRVVHAYRQDHTVVIDGRERPVPSLLEDDDGVRFLLVAGPRFAQGVWVDAREQGVQGIYHPGSITTVVHDHDDGHCVLGGTTTIEGSPWWYVERELAIDGVVEEQDDFILADHYWKPFERVHPFRDLPQEPTRKLDKGFVHLHTHTEFSSLDGLSTVDELIVGAVADGQPAIAVTDHGRCAGHPDLSAKAANAGIKPIYGVEAYLVDDRFERPGDAPKKPTQKQVKGDPSLLEQWEADRERHDANRDRISSEYYHLTLWAESDDGLHNLWGANTEANRTGFYRHPRMDWDVLKRYSAGVMASTGCLRGPVPYWLLRGDEDRARAHLARLMETFGDGLWVELHTNRMEEQKLVNQIMVDFANQYGLPTIAVSDSHYPTKDKKGAHQIWLAAQTNKELQDEKGLFESDDDYHLMTEVEVRESLSYLPPQVVDEAVGNTLAVAERCNARLTGEPQAPVYSKKGGAQRDIERLREVCEGSWDEFVAEGKIVYADPHEGECERDCKCQRAYEARFEREMALLASEDKLFCGYFLQVSDYVLAAKNYHEPDAPPGRRRILVGPGRGSGSGSFVAYLCRITEIDPVAEEIIFERFLTQGRKALPDFDVDFPSWARDWIQDYVLDKFGEDHVARVGTIMRMRNKGTVQAMSRVLSSIEDMEYRDAKAVADIIDAAESHSAGLGISWDELWEQHSDELAEYRERYPKIFAAADETVGRVRAYGRHPAGWIVSDESLVDRWPLRLAGDQMVTEFDQHILEALYLVKFDLLTIRNLDTISMALDLIEDRFGIFIDPYKWGVEYQDSYVWDQICAGHTLGCFQIETAPMTNIVTRLQPKSISELADAVTLVRPGPQQSGLTDLYLARKHGQEDVTYPDPRLEASLKPTYGAMIYQEQVLTACMELAHYTEDEADKLRKLMGKKQVELVAEAGKKFIAACVDNGMDEQRAEWFWGQMSKFARYGFNKAHAWAYALVAYWCSWLKFNYPLEFLTALLSTGDKSGQPDYVREAWRLGYKVLPPDINQSGRGFSAVDTLTIRYGLDSVKGVGVSADDIIEAQPYESWRDFLDRALDVKGNRVDSGTVATLAAVGAFDSLVPNRRALEFWLEDRKTGVDVECVYKDESVLDAPNGLPCTFDWASEPPPISKKTGKELKRKPIAKRCTKACRNYTPPAARGPRDLEVVPYTPVEIRQREKEMLGSHLSSTPFDYVSEDDMAKVVTLDRLNRVREGKFGFVATVEGFRQVRDRNGRAMAFVSLGFPKGQGVVDAVIFKDEWKKYRQGIKRVHDQGGLLVGEIKKGSRGPIITYVVSTSC